MLVNLYVLKNSKGNLGLANAVMAHPDPKLPILAVVEGPQRLHCILKFVYMIETRLHCRSTPLTLKTVRGTLD